MIDIEQYLNSFFKGTKDPSLDAMQYFMDQYDNFQEKMKFIHVAGTNGKGSCVEIISNILVKQGYKVGKFISPHLIKYNERISINGRQISNEEMSELIEELKPKIEEYNKKQKVNVTLFELETTMALLYFYRNDVDFAVLETGLGGLYDCTNIITNPLFSVITSIGYDHMHILGNTLSEIAYQKAGIIKEKSNTVFFEQSEEINKVFIDVCQEKKNNLCLVKQEKIQNYHYDNQYQYFDYEDYKNLAIVLKGKKQVQNAVICIEGMKILKKLGYVISERSIREGLKTVIHKARMEILNEKPLIIYDGAHNEPAIENLQSMVNMYYSNLKRVYIVSILKRKDYEKMIQLLLEDKEAEFVFTSGNNPERYATKEELYNIALKYRTNQKMNMKNLSEAIEYIYKDSNNVVNFIIGSFYTYGTTINKIKEIRNDRIKGSKF